jgi:YcxB-like protein
MTISFRNTFRDHLAFAAYHMLRSPLFLVAAAVILALLTFSMVVPAVSGTEPAAGRVFGFVFMELLLVIAIAAFFALTTILGMVLRKDKTLMAERTVTLGEDGFMVESIYAKSEYKWPMIRKLARTNGHVFLYFSQLSALVIPRRAFEGVAQRDAFYDYCRRKTQVAG